MAKTVTLDDLARSNATRQRSLLQSAAEWLFRDRLTYGERHEDIYWVWKLELTAEDLESLLEQIEQEGKRATKTGRRAVFGTGYTDSYSRKYPRSVVEAVEKRIQEKIEELHS